ncbi:MAG: hypothetical protein ACPF9D_03695 [Owenweeksia sp.]
MTKLNEHLDLQRLWALVKLETVRSRRGIGMTFIIVFDLLFFVSMLLGLYVEPEQKVFEHYDSYSSSLLITGFILSSLAYRDLGHTLKRYNYLTLPASALEKFLSQWLLTSLGWILLYTLAYTVYTWLANPIGRLIFNEVEFESFSPFHPQVLASMKFYFVLQGIFLVGSVQFRGYAFAKTLGVLSLFAGACFLVTYVMMKDLFLSPHECSDTDCELLDHFGAHYIWPLACGLFWWLLAPLTWLITYLGIKEKEV